MKFKIGDKVIVTDNLSGKIFKGEIVEIKEDGIWPYLIESESYGGKHRENFNDKYLTLDIERIRNEKLEQLGINES